jgi:hypothetical protein
MEAPLATKPTKGPDRDAGSPDAWVSRCRRKRYGGLPRHCLNYRLKRVIQSYFQDLVTAACQVLMYPS